MQKRARCSEIIRTPVSPLWMLTIWIGSTDNTGAILEKGLAYSAGKLGNLSIEGAYMLAAAAYTRSFAVNISSMWEISVHISNVGVPGPVLKENLGLLRCNSSRYSLCIQNAELLKRYSNESNLLI